MLSFKRLFFFFFFSFFFLGSGAVRLQSIGRPSAHSGIFGLRGRKTPMLTVQLFAAIYLTMSLGWRKWPIRYGARSPQARPLGLRFCRARARTFYNVGVAEGRSKGVSCAGPQVGAGARPIWTIVRKTGCVEI